MAKGSNDKQAELRWRSETHHDHRDSTTRDLLFSEEQMLLLDI
jgi:hypothetical protein